MIPDVGTIGINASVRDPPSNIEDMRKGGVWAHSELIIVPWSNQLKEIADHVR